jgi:hypothetical protein
MDEQSLIMLLKEALVLAETSHTEQQIEASEFELLALRVEFEVRSKEQVLYYQKTGLPKAHILDYQASIQICLTQIEQMLLELRHKEFML